MKKVLYVGLILLVLFIGVIIGDAPHTGQAGDIRDRTRKFEEEITRPDNQYNHEHNIITPNNTNKLAKRGDSIIKGIFEYSFGLLKGVIE